MGGSSHICVLFSSSLGLAGQGRLSPVNWRRFGHRFNLGDATKIEPMASCEAEAHEVAVASAKNDHLSSVKLGNADGEDASSAADSTPAAVSSGAIALLIGGILEELD